MDVKTNNKQYSESDIQILEGLSGKETPGHVHWLY